MSDTSKAVARYDGPRTVAELATYSQMLAVNSTPDGRSWQNAALPATFRGNPASVAFAVEYAKALDVSPVTAIMGVHMIDGKLSASAGLISALVRRAGHKVRTWIEGSIADGNAKAITTITREDDPEFEYRSEWTIARAVQAKLMKRTDAGTVVATKSGSAWDTYPENMLKSRSITECARDAAEDAILGVHYTPEELGHETDENGEIVYSVTQVQEQPRTETPPQAAEDRPQEPGTPSVAQPDVDAERVAEAVRIEILRARSTDDLRVVWSHPDLIHGSSTRAEFLEVADEAGTMTNALELFKAATAAIQEGRRLSTAYDDPDVVQGTVEDPLGGSGQGDDEPDGDVEDAVVVDPSGGHTPETEAKMEALKAEVAAAGPKPAGGVGMGRPAQQRVGERLTGSDDDRTPSVAIGDPRHGVNVPGFANAVERAEAIKHLPIPDANAEFDQIMKSLPPVLGNEAFSWARSQGYNPRNSAANVAVILRAVATGDAFSDATLEAIAAGDLDDPSALLIRVLGGTVVDQTPNTKADAAQLAREEDRQDAAAATVPRAGASSERSQAARDQARDAARAARK